MIIFVLCDFTQWYKEGSPISLLEWECAGEYRKAHIVCQRLWSLHKKGEIHPKNVGKPLFFPHEQQFRHLLKAKFCSCAFFMRSRTGPFEAIRTFHTKKPNPFWKRTFLQAMARGCHLPKAKDWSSTARRSPCAGLDQIKAGPRVPARSIFFYRWPTALPICYQISAIKYAVCIFAPCHPTWLLWRAGGTPKPQGHHHLHRSTQQK